MAKPYEVVVITGASSGLGRELALSFARLGCKIGLLARRKERLDELSQDLAQLGVDHKAVVADVTCLTDVKAAFKGIEAAIGPVDLLIANAGVSYPSPAKGFDANQAAQVYRVNVFGVLNCLEAVLPGMIERRSGHIVGISSLASYGSFPASHAYCGSKSALSAQLEGLRRELRFYGITVTTICPGFIRTEMTVKNRFPMPFLMDVKPAVAKITKAILAKKKVYNFPLATYLLVRLSNFLPDALLGNTMRK